MSFIFVCSQVATWTGPLVCASTRPAVAPCDGGWTNPGPSGSGCAAWRGRRPCNRSTLQRPPPQPPRLAQPTAPWEHCRGEAELRGRRLTGLLRPLPAPTMRPRTRRSGEEGLGGHERFLFVCWIVGLVGLLIDCSVGVFLKLVEDLAVHLYKCFKYRMLLNFFLLNLMLYW